MLSKNESFKENEVNESEIQQKIQIEGPYHNCQLLRNNSGALKNNRGEVVRYGLGNISSKHNKQMKSSDLIGFTTKVITPDMIGKTVAIFTAVEVKAEHFNTSDERIIAQQNFINWVVRHGGIAGFAKSVDDFKVILKSW